jgi:hypothetical protein
LLLPSHLSPPPTLTNRRRRSPRLLPLPTQKSNTKPTNLAAAAAVLFSRHRLYKHHIQYKALPPPLPLLLPPPQNQNPKPNAAIASMLPPRHDPI